MLEKASMLLMTFLGSNFEGIKRCCPSICHALLSASRSIPSKKSVARYCRNTCRTLLDVGGCSLLCSVIRIPDMDHGCNNVCDKNLVSCMKGNNLADISVNGNFSILVD